MRRRARPTTPPQRTTRQADRSEANTAAPAGDTAACHSAPPRAADGPRRAHRWFPRRAERGRRHRHNHGSDPRALRTRRPRRQPTPPPAQPSCNSTAAVGTPTTTPPARFAEPSNRRRPHPPVSFAPTSAAIETKNVDLFRSVRPDLSERRRGPSSGQLQTDRFAAGRHRRRRPARRRSNGNRSSLASRHGDERRTTTNQRKPQTLRFEKAAAGWIITEIVGYCSVRFSRTNVTEGETMRVAIVGVLLAVFGTAWPASAQEPINVRCRSPSSGGSSRISTGRTDWS
jgi:hypothetical protein